MLASLSIIYFIYLLFIAFWMCRKVIEMDICGELEVLQICSKCDSDWPMTTKVCPITCKKRHNMLKQKMAKILLTMENKLQAYIVDFSSLANIRTCYIDLLNHQLKLDPVILFMILS